jgi:hypothetical protein
VGGVVLGLVVGVKQLVQHQRRDFEQRVFTGHETGFDLLDREM